MESTPSLLARAREFAESLARLESIAPLYPPSHARSLEACGRVGLAVRGLAAEKPELRVETAQDRLVLGGMPLGLEDASLAELHREFDALGILEFAVDASAAPEDLHRLACALRGVAQRLSATRTLQNIDFGDLPPSIRMRHREFGRRVGRPESRFDKAAALQEYGEAAAQPLAESAIDPLARAACREWVDLSLRRIVERVEARIPPPGTPAPEDADRDLQSVLQVASQTLGHALGDFLANAAGQDDLAQMFRSIEVASAVCEDPESARLMLETLREAAVEVLEPEDPDPLGPDDEPGTPAAASTESFASSLEELCGKLMALEPELKQLTGLEREDRSEVLGIVFAGLQRVESVEAAARFAERLPPLLYGERTPREEATFTNALRALCAGGNEAAIDRSLPVIAEFLAAPAHEEWLRIVVETAAACAPGRLSPLWPHLANELLLGRRNLSAVLLARVAEQVARLPEASLHMGVIRLCGLSALAGGRLSRGAFDELRDDLSRFCAALLRSPHAEKVGELLLESLRRCPPPWHGSVVFRTFTNGDAACRDLLLDLLRHGTFHRPGAQTVAECGRLLARRLLALPAENAAEPWVVPAIEALGALPSREAARALQRILDERRKLVIPLWPGPCRAAAGRALASLERSASR